MTRQLILNDNPDALAWAKRYFDTLRTTPDPVMGVYWLQKEGSRRVIIEMFKAWAKLSAHNMLQVIDAAAAGWDIPHEALRELIIEYDERHELKPHSLGTYNTKILRGFEPKLRSTQKANQALRNIAIAHAVRVLSEHFGLPPTGRKGSASAVVANAMKGKGGQILTHRAVEKVCEDFSFWADRFDFFNKRLQQLTA